MNDVERQLRDVLTRHAQAAPEGHLMLSRVRRVAARRRRRRALLGGAAAVLALVALGTTVLTGRLTGPGAALRMGTAPSVAGVSPGVDFVAGAPVDVTFPLAPKAPPVPGTVPQLMLVAGRPTLQYVPAGAIPPPAASPAAPADAIRSGALPGLVPSGGGQAGTVPPGTAPYGALPSDPVTVVTAGSPWTGGPFTPSRGARRITVDGRPAILGDRTSSGATEHVLSWTQRAGLWVGVSAPDSIPTGVLTGYAARLAEAPITQPGPFDFDLLPAGYAVDNLSSSTVTFTPPGVRPSPDFVGKLVVSADTWPPDPGAGRSVSVGGRPGRLHTTGNVVILEVDEGGGWGLTVQLPTGLGVAEPDLLRFAAGVHITAHATPASG